MISNLHTIETTPIGAFPQPKAAQYMGISVRTLQRLEQEGSAPTRIAVGRRVLYLREDLDAWLRSKRETGSNKH